MMNSITDYSEYIASLASALSKYSPLEYLPADQSNLYTFFEANRLALTPLNIYSSIMRRFFANPLIGTNIFATSRRIGANFEMIERLTWEYPRPEYNIEETEINGKKYKIEQATIEEKPFCRLIHFKKKTTKTAPSLKQEKILIIAPLSGHFATLCRGTIQAVLPYFDVYITDWKNARNIPQSEGRFNLDDYTEYLIGYFTKLLENGDDLNIMAVCQPCVPALAAIALMHSHKAKYLPKSCILIGGPIDVRKNPTSVNDVASERSFNWFSNNVISNVPANCAGAGRKVYPGFLQLANFITMNLQRHIKSHQDLYAHLQEGDEESADYLKDFYNEYLAVMDITAEFYLQTLKVVFQEYHLPKGIMKVNGKLVKPQDITKTKLMVIEGERDDITGQKQTKAALDLCTNLPSHMKQYLLQEDVGHYGSFTGSKFKKFITPKIVGFCETKPPQSPSKVGTKASSPQASSQVSTQVATQDSVKAQTKASNKTPSKASGKVSGKVASKTPHHTLKPPKENS